MYTYYLLAALLGKDPKVTILGKQPPAPVPPPTSAPGPLRVSPDPAPSLQVRRKYLWWGQYLTMFQMGQFVSMMAQATYVWQYSDYPKPIATLLFYYMQVSRSVCPSEDEARSCVFRLRLTGRIYQ